MPDFKLRPARPADLDALVALENKVFDGDRLSRRSLRDFIASPRVALLVALCAEKTLAGYALLAFRANSRHARLYSICVDPAVGRRGVGALLLARCEAAAKARGMHGLRLEVRVDNAAAAALYGKRRYATFGRLEDYYEDGAAALRLEKRLRTKGAPP